MDRFSQVKRFRENVISDIRDNFESKEAPRTLERTLKTPEDSKKLLMRLFPEEARENLCLLTQSLPLNTPYRARALIGAMEKGTRHAHDFIIEKTEEGVSLFFVDPEHHVGENNWRRPPVGNIATAYLPADKSKQPDIAIIRFRTPELVKKKGIATLKLEPQYGHARELIERDGIPQFLEDIPEEILFRAAVKHGSHGKDGKMLVQSRYIDGRDANLFLDGAPSASVLEGKIASQQAILKTFIKLLREEEFNPILERRGAAEQTKT